MNILSFILFQDTAMIFKTYYEINLVKRKNESLLNELESQRAHMTTIVDSKNAEIEYMRRKISALETEYENSRHEMRRLHEVLGRKKSSCVIL